MITRELHTAGVPLLNGEQDAFATTLLGILLKAFGPQVLEWDGITIQLEVKDEFAVEMPRRVYDRLMSLLTAITTDRPYVDVAFFDEMVSSLCGRGVILEQDPPSVEDLAWAVTELRLNDPEPASRDAEQPFDRNIQKYMRVVLDDEGFTIAPDALPAATRTPGHDENVLPEDYQAIWESHQEMANAIDQTVIQRLGLLFDQLRSIGVERAGLEDTAQVG